MRGWHPSWDSLQDEQGALGGLLMALGSLGIIFIMATIGWTIYLGVPYKVLFSPEERQRLTQEAEMAAIQDQLPAMPAPGVPPPPIAGVPTTTAPAAVETPSPLAPILTWRVGPEGVGKSVEQLALEKQQAEIETERLELARLKQEMELERKNLEAIVVRLDDKLKELKTIMVGADSVRTARIEEMVKLYSAMRPPDAAKGLQALANKEQNLTVVAEVIRNMKERQAGRVMAQFDTTFQAQVGQLISNPFSAVK